MQRELTFTVVGLPQSKGSAKAFIPHGWTRAIITSSNKNLRGWEDAIRAALQVHAHGIFFDGPVHVQVTFELPRPKTLARKTAHHTKRPDLDKLVRGTLDAMTGALWHDDGQVFAIEAAKCYAVSQPCAHFTIVGDVSSRQQELLDHGQEIDQDPPRERSLDDILRTLAERDARHGADAGAAEGLARLRRPGHRRD